MREIRDGRSSKKRKRRERKNFLHRLIQERIERRETAKRVCVSEKRREKREREERRERGEREKREGEMRVQVMSLIYLYRIYMWPLLLFVTLK